MKSPKRLLGSKLLNRREFLTLVTLSLPTAVKVFNQPSGLASLNKKIFLPFIINHSDGSIVKKGTYYLSPTGADSNLGTTESQAWATFSHAWQHLYPGDTLILLDGVYLQSLSPSVRDGAPDQLITIRAKNDGMAIIDGEFKRIPVELGPWANPQVGNYYDIEGIVARNSNDMVYSIWGSHNVLRRVSGYNANTDTNSHVFCVSDGEYNLLEDCIASGTGRKMILIWGGDHNVVRRCFTNWVNFEGKEWDSEWPWGEDLEFYNSSNNIMENCISYGSPVRTGVSVLGNINSSNGNNPYTHDNKILGVIAMRVGVYKDGTFWEWPTTRPQPTTDDTIQKYHEWPNMRVGYGLFMCGETALVSNTSYQDIFSWGNAGLGFCEYALSGQKSVNTSMNRATILNNGLDATSSDGGPGTNVQSSQISQYSITNSNIAGTQYTGGGAIFVNRYVDGILNDGTNGAPNEPLWPWPMGNRILTELGIDVTGEITEILRTNNVSAGRTIPVPIITPIPLVVDNEIACVPCTVTYTQAVTITLSTSLSGATIRYTLDGSEPTSSSAQYTRPFTLSLSTFVKAKTFYNNQESYSCSAYYRINLNATNNPPTVMADLLPFRYSYIDIMLPTNQVGLYGLATDDTLLGPGTLTTTWSQISGPGSVTFGDSSKPRTIVNFPSVTGTYVLRLTASDGQLMTSKDVTVHVWPQDNVGTVFTIPGRIDMVNYKAGGEGVGYHKISHTYGGVYRSGSVAQTIAYNDWYGYAISYIAPAEWYAYDVNIPTAGTYTLNISLAGAAAGGVIHIELRDSQGYVTNLSGPITIPLTNDGYRIYTTISRSVLLPQGKYEIRMVGDQSAPEDSHACTNVHYLQFTLP